MDLLYVADTWRFEPIELFATISSLYFTLLPSMEPMCLSEFKFINVLLYFTLYYNEFLLHKAHATCNCHASILLVQREGEIDS